MRDRVAFETKDLATQYAGALWASERWFARTNPLLAARLRATRHGIEREFGWKARLAARVVGPVVLATLWREERRLRRGRTYEPPTFYEANPAAAGARRGGDARGSPLPLGRAAGPDAPRRAKPSPERGLYSRRPSQRVSRPDSFFEAASSRTARSCS